ncbi:hypothetical protein, partial [Klebsiella pneumoniae]|uniref:hypothetical protein n=1 Tax=Klebsiella pneumoniae TaxID=573 RepID=UPI001D0D3F9C
MGSCAAPSAKGDDKFITTDYLQQCHLSLLYSPLSAFTQGCIVVMRYIRLCIISLLATLPLAVHASPQP